MSILVTVRCYAELGDFLSPGRRQRSFCVSCARGTSVKDLLEGLGVPHTEVDLVLVNGDSVTFEARLADGDRVAAYPVFESFDVATVTRVRVEPLREPRFVLDAHLGRLAGLLRLAGFDAAYRNDYADAELASASRQARRILLTRDQALLKRRIVTHGYYVRSTSPRDQLAEVVRRFQLSRLARPFTRCLRCNGRLEPIAKEAAAGQVPPRSHRHYDSFLQCADCRRVYWEGSHHERLKAILAGAIENRG